MKYCKTKLNNEISVLLKDINLTQYHVEHNDWKYSVFVPFFKNERLLELYWKEVSDVICTSYQTLLKGQDNLFEKWNLYVIYICTEKVKKSLKAKIQNDKFSNRKIVEDNFNGELNTDIANSFIIKHITNTDLIDLVSEDAKKITKPDNYQPNNSFLWGGVPKISLKGKTEVQEKTLSKILKLISHED